MDLYQQKENMLKQLVEIENDAQQMMGSSSPIYQHLVDVEQELRDWQPYNAQPPAIRTIYLERAEGVGAGQALSLRTIEEADAILGVWARTAPAHGSGYDKTDVEITFDDGSEIRLRADLNCDTEQYLANRPGIYTVYVTGDVCRLGKDVWTGGEIYSQWALHHAMTHCQSNEFVRLVVHDNYMDTYIVQTTVSGDPIRMLRGMELMRKTGDAPPRPSGAR